MRDAKACSRCGTRLDENNEHSFCSAAAMPETRHAWEHRAERSMKTGEPAADRVPTVPEMLRAAAGINEERGKLYGDNYKHVGEIMRGLFPRGVRVYAGDVDGWNRLHFVFHFVNKLSRYCQNMERNGTGHVDSLDDLAVYAMMAKECDLEERRRSGVTADARRGTGGRGE